MHGIITHAHVAKNPAKPPVGSLQQFQVFSTFPILALRPPFVLLWNFNQHIQIQQVNKVKNVTGKDSEPPYIFNSSLSYNHWKFLTGYTVTIVSCHVGKMTMTCLSMFRHVFDINSTDREW